MPEDRNNSPWRHIPKDTCLHLNEVKEGISSEKDSCEVCGGREDLRICLSCGYVACCESHGSHDTEHFKTTDHALIRPHRCDYDFLWCYKCYAFLDE